MAFLRKFSSLLVASFTILAWLGCEPPTGSESPPIGDDSLPPAPDFSLTVEPASQTIPLEGTVQFNVDIAFLNGFLSTNITFWVRDVPSRVSVTFDPNPLPHQGRSVMTVVEDGNATPGTFAFTVGADAEGLTHSQDVTLEIIDQPDFTVAISPSTQSVAVGGSADYNVTVTSLNGFSSPVTMTISGLPAAASAQFSPNPVTPTATSILTISTSQSTSPNAYALTITGTEGPLQHSTQATLNVNPAGSVWSISSVGTTGASNNSVLVGPARNDGVDRVYVGTVTTGRVREFTWTAGAWSAGLDIGGSPAGQEIHNMGMGTGRNDGVIRIYAGSLDDNLYEITYDGSGWTQTVVGSPSGSATHAAVEKARDDGVDRVYATRGPAVWEYSWTGSAWNAVQVGTVMRGIAHGIAIGDGRGDGGPHLYVATTGGGVYEATFSNGEWSMGNIASLGDVRNVNVGVGRNDGVPRVYAAGANGTMSELTWTGSGWSVANLNASLGAVLVHADVVDGRNDGVRRVYTSAANGNAYEFTWDGSGWTIYTLGGGSDYLYGLHFGRGRNDGTIRLYGASFNTQVYEYTWR